MASEGVTDDLMEPPLACVVPREPFAEYGVIEYRFRQQYPELFSAHVRDQRRVLIGTRDYTASAVRFGVPLSRLARSGDLVSRYGPAAGAWAYNGQMTYWAEPPVQDGELLTRARYCASIGRPPSWTDEDRAACLD
jgi:hypothetical protein